MRKLIKRIGVTFIAFLFVLNSLSLPGISSVLADENAIQRAVVSVNETTESTSYQEPLVDEPVNELPPAAVMETEEHGYLEDTQAVSDAAEPDAEVVDIPASEIALSVDEITEDGSEAVETLNSEEEQSVSEGEEQADETLNDDVTDDQKNTEITEESMPAMTFEDYVEDIYVKVEAEEKTFPEGTWMKVVYVEAWKIIDSVDKAVEGEVEDVKAVDITFYDKDGKEIQPEKPVSVKLQIAGMEEAADQAVFHVDNEGKVDVLTEATVEEDIASFDAEKFSTYGVALKAAVAEEDAEPVRGDGEEEEEPIRATGDTWEVFFDPTTNPEEVLTPIVIQIADGEAIGDQLPAVPEVPGYITFWVNAEDSTQKITSETIVTSDMAAVVGREKIVYTVTFVQEDETEETRTTDIDAGFAVNDLPTVTPKTNKIGKWVYPGTTNEFTVGTVISEDLTVNAYYEQNIFTVTFMVDNARYEEMTTATGTTIVLPSDPVKPGTTFIGWFTEPDGKGTQYTSTSTVSEDLTLYAYFEGQVRVSFIVKDDNGNIISEKSQYFVDLTTGDKITTLPDDPFVEGKVFDHWENETTGDEVSLNYTVTESFNAVAVFRGIQKYQLTVHYYYMNGDNEITIQDQVFDLIESDFPYTVTAPATATASEIAGQPVYYPSAPTITVSKDQFGDGNTLTVKDEFVPPSASYKVGHYLKNLSGEGYTLIETVNKVGVENSTVTPDVNSYSYAEFESRDEDITIIGDSDQELKVYYTRRDFTLSYNVGEGDYINANTAPYGTSITLPTTATRDGYTFAGWYANADYSGSRLTTFTLNDNTTLYAKWNAAQSEYKIVYMIENAEDDGYSYLASVTKQAATGSSITMTAQTAGANGTRPRDLDTTNFTFKDSTTETVRADGTTVVTVRYSRNIYTLESRTNGYSASVTAKYGADITQEWSSQFNRHSGSWSYNNQNNSKFKSLTIMPSLSVRTNSSPANTIYVYHHNDTASYYQHLEYWLQNYEDGDATTTYNGKTYGRVKSVDMRYNYLSNVDDWYEITGYTKAGYTAEHRRNTNSNWQSFTYTWNRNFSQYGNQYTYTRFNFYYDAEKYPLTFYNYDGTLISTQEVTLGDSISSYLTNNIPSAPMDGATWLGWFTDQKHTSPYSGGTKMPAGLALYGNFAFPTRTISYDSQGGSAVASETDEYGFYATMPANPTKEHYTFQGWFTAPDETGSPYDWNKPVTENITLYAHWNQETISYTVHYYNQGTTTKVLEDKVVSDPTFKEHQSITEYAPSVANNVADNSSVTKELSFNAEENTIIFYYHPIPDQLTYTVNYVLKDYPNIKVAESKTITVPGTTTNVLEMAVEVDSAYLATQTSDQDILRKHYKPKESTKELQLGLSNNVITFEYVSYTTSKITVNYLDMDGNSIHASDSTYVEKGDTFTVQNKAPEGYVYHHAYLDGTTEPAKSTYQITGNEGNLVINIYYQKKLIIIANNKSKPYDGTALFSSFANASDYTITGNMRGDTITSLEFDGSQTNAGTSATTPKNATISTGAQAITDPETYYSIIYVPGSLTVKPISVYISISADQWNTHSGSTGGPNYYTGQAFNVGFTNTTKQHFNDDTSKSAYVSITSSQRTLFKEKYGDAIWNALYGENGALISQKDAGTYTYTGDQQKALIAAISVDGQAMMSDPNYSITLFARDSFLTIEPLPLSIATPTDSKQYDGTALTKSEGATLDHNYWTANIGGTWTAAATAAPGSVTLGTGDTITFNVTGSQTEVGNSDNTYEIVWGETKSSNYKVTAALGNLEVTYQTLTLTIKDRTVTYNSTEQSGYSFPAAGVQGTGSVIDTAEYTITGLAEGQTLTVSYTPAKGTDARTYTNGSFVTDIKIMQGEGDEAVDVTEYYDIQTPTAGKLIINPANVTLTANSDTKPYNGSAQTVTGFSSSVAGLAFEGVSASGSGTNAGTYPVTFTGVTVGETKDTTGNYVVSEIKNGTLTINPIDVKVTITGHTNSAPYDGTEHSVSGYDVAISNPLYTETDFTFSGTAEAKRTDVGTTNMGLASSNFSNTNTNFSNVTFEVTDGYQTITPIEATVTITGHTNSAPYDGDEHSVSGYDVEISNPLYKATDFTFGGTASASRTAAGTTDMGLAASQFTNTNTNFSNVIFNVTDGYQTITPIDVTVTITGHFDSTTYDGDEHSVSGYDVSISNPLYRETDFTFNGTATAARTDAGKTNMGLEAGKFTNTNSNFGTVTFAVTDGYQEIVPVEEVVVTITGHNNTTAYDGEEHSVSGYDVQISNPLYKEADFTFNGTATAARADAGTTNMGLAASQFTNTNGNFATVTFNVTDGYQTITPIDVTVTITGHNNTADYDGAKHSVSGYDVQIENPLYTEADFTFSGTATAARTDAGTTNMGLAASQFANTNPNFGTVTFNVTDGYQTIDPINVTVTITGHSNTADYDGAEHSVGGYDVTISNSLYKETDFTFSGTATAARINVGTTNMGLAAEQFSNNNSNFGTVTFDVTDGYQTINPIDVTVTIVGKSNTANYDGEEHSVNGYDVTISNSLYKETDFTFSGTATATRTNVGTTNMGLAAEQFSNNNSNFGTVTFNVTDGYQKINPISVIVTITGHNNTTAYDGEEHSVSGYDVEISNPLYTAADFAFSGTAAAARANAGTTNMGLAASQFTNTNTNFETVTFNVTDGYQAITPIDVTVTIIGANNTTAYDGTEHSVSGYTATASTDLYDVTKDFTFSGTAEADRMDVGTTNMGLAASQFANTNPNFGTVTFDVTDGYQTITPIDVTVTIIGANSTTAYDGAEHSVSGYSATASTDLYNVNNDFTFSGTAVASRTNAGTTNMGLAASQFTNTNPNFGTVTFEVTDGYQTITPIDVTVTIVGTNNTIAYDGEEHSVSGYTATANTTLYDVDNDFTFSGTAVAARTDAGTTNMGLAADQFANTNSNFATVTFEVTDGYQTIIPIDVTVTIIGANNTAVYDGEEHSVSGYSATASSSLYDVENDLTFSGTAEAARTDAGTTNMGLAADQFANTNDNFATVTFNVTDGYQAITPVDEVVVTITGRNNTTDYDGAAHGVSGYDVQISNPLYKEADFTFNGTATAARTEAGTTNMGLAADQFANTNPNFAKVTFNVTDGYQTITPINVTVTIVGANNLAPYDGTEHKVTGYTATASTDLYDVDNDFTFSGTAEATRTDAGTTNMGLSADQFANTNDNFATVTFNVTDGYQKIDPIDVTITIVGANNTTDYDGEEHSVTGYTATASTDLYDVTKDFTFSGNATAARTVAGTTNMGLTDSQFVNTNTNFGVVTFNVTDGYQTINPIDVTVTIVGANNTTDYDGQRHSVSGYSATANSALYNVNEDISFSGTAEAERTDAGTTTMGLTEEQFANKNPNFGTVTFNVTDGYQTITPINVTVTIVGANNTTDYDGAVHTVTGYTATANSNLYDVTKDFTFSGNDSASRTDAGTTNMGLAAGQFTNTNSNFGTVTFEVTDGYQTITPIDVTVTITEHSDEVDYDGVAHTVSGYDVSINNTLYTTADFTFSGNKDVTGTNAGTYNMELKPEDFTNTNGNFGTVNFVIVDGQLVIKPIDVTIAIVGANDTSDYDGEAHTVTGYTATASTDLYDVENDFTFNGTATASRTDVGTANMGLASGQFVNTNPNFGTVTFEVTDGYQTIEPIDVTVTIVGANNTTDYNGEEHTVTGYTATASTDLYDVENDFTFNGTATASRTDAGTTNMGLAAGQFTNTNTNFKTVTFDVTDGYQTINKINATVTITGHTSSVTYDGIEHTVSGYDASFSTSLYTASDFSFNGTATASRTDVGTANMGLAAEQFTNTNTNFETVTFNVTDGYQEIVPVEEVVVTITGHKNTAAYDGEEHSVSGYDVTISNPLYKTADFTFGGTAVAAKTDVGTATMGLSADQFTNYNTNFAKVTFNVTDGYQTITPINVTVTIVGANDTKPYDGKDHTVTGYTATASSDLYDVTKDFTFSGNAEATQKDVGTANMGLAASQFTNTNPNFATVTFDVTDGYQTITPIDVTVTIVGANNTTNYDGEDHTVTGYTATANSNLYDVTKDFTFSGNATASRTDTGTTNMGLAAEQFANTNPNFATVTFNVTDGYQTITPINVTVTIVGTNDTTAYDGNSHTVRGYTKSASSPLYDVEKDFAFSGTAEATQTNVGTAYMDLSKEQFTNTNPNFGTVTFNVTDGYQTITPINVTVTIVGANNTTDYDGEEHTVTGYTATASTELYDVENDFAFSGNDTASRADAGTTNMGLAADQFANTNNNFGTVTFEVTDGYQTIDPIDVTVTIVGANDTTDYDGEEHTVTGYTATASTELYDVENDFTFSGDDSASRTDAGTTNMGLTTGQFANTNENFGTVTFEVTDGYQTIDPIDVTVTIVGANNTTDYDGEEHTVTGYTATASTDLYDVENDFTFSGNATASQTDVGTEYMGLAKEQFTNTNSNFGTVTFEVTDGYQTIDPIDVTVTIVGANNTTDYDGETHTVTGYTATASTDLYDVENDFTFSGNATASQTDVGTANMGLAAGQFANTNENFGTVTFEVTDGYQTIEPIDVTVTIVGASNTTDYDGEEHTVTGYTASASTELYDVEKDFTFSGTATASRIDAGTTNMGLKSEQFANTNPNFGTVTFNVTDGYQTINRINVTVTIVGASNTTIYDGEAHTVTGYTATASTDLYDVENDFTFSGEATATRTVVGTTNMGLKSEQFTNTNENFGTVTFEVTDGYQTITPVDEVVVTITGHYNTTNYDGNAHGVSGYDVEISNELYTVEDFTFSGTSEASRTDAGTTNMGLVAEQFTNTNENFAKVTFNVTDGYQTIDPINVTVTITGKNNTSDYDGSEHKVTGYDVEINNPLYTEADFTFSGEATASRKEAGTTNMGLAAEQFTNTNPNFGTVTFNVTDGYQTINPINVTVTITGKNNTTDYDGEEHTVTGYTATASTELYDVENDFTFSGEATASRKEAGTTNMNLTEGQFANTNKNFAKVTFNVTDGYQTINPINVTVTITEHSDKVDYDGQSHTVTGYDVEISNPLYTEADFTFNGTDEVSGTDAGSYDMELKPEDFTNNNKNFATVTFNIVDGKLVIDPIDVTVTITEHSDEVDYDGEEHTVTGYDVEISSPLYKETDIAFTGTASVSGTDAGIYDMELQQADFTNTNDNFKSVTFVIVDGQLVINPIDVTVTITEHSDEVDYDGEEHTVTGYDVAISNPLYKEADFTFSGNDSVSGTDAGSYDMQLKAEDFKNTNDNFANVTFEIVDGQLVINPIDVTVTITEHSDEVEYDGKEHTATGYDVEISNPLYKEADFTFSGNDSVSGTDAGSYDMELKAEDFANTNQNFANVTFRIVDGQLVIKPINVTVTITGHHNTATFDGDEHSVSGYDVEISNELYTEADFTFSGTAEAARTDEGTTNMGLAADQFANINPNFATVTFNVTDGYQTITPIDEVVVTITGKHNTTDYDGEEHSVSGYDVEISNPLYKEADFTFSGTAEAARTDAGTTEMGLAAEQFANTNPNFAKVTFNVTDGYQTIDPISVTVTITEHSDKVDYDGKAHTVKGYDVAIDNDLYTEADFTFSGTAEVSGTDAGSYDMELKADDFKNTNENFTDVTFVIKDGQLVISPINVTVTITGKNNTTDYDGKEHEVTGYDVTISDPLYKENDFTFSGAAAAKRTDAGTTNMGLAKEQFENTNPNFATVTFNVTDGYQTITPINVTVTIVGNNNTADYNGAEHTVSGYTATASSDLYDVENDFTFSGTAEAKRTEVGTTNMNLAVGQFANTNENFATVTFEVTDGYQTIEPIDVTVTIVGNNNTAPYDGNSHEVTGYTATTNSNLFDVTKDFTFNGTAAAKRVDVGTTNMNLAADQFVNTNTNFKTVTFNVTDGYQTIEPINVTVTIVGANNTAAYDGSEHKVSGYTATASTDLYDVNNDFTFSGTAEAKRTEAGTTNMNLAADQFVNTNTNFKTVTFNVTDGYQTIDPINVTVTITGHHNSTTYDGKEHSVIGYDVEISNDLYNETDFTFSGTAEAKRTEAGTTNMNLAADQFANTNTNFKTVTFNVTDGYQTIVPVDEVVVTITGHHNTSDYDGTEHSVSGYDVEISNELYTEADFIFSGTAEAARTDAGTTNMGLNAEQFENINENFENVTFIVEDGYQTIAPINVTVTITGKNNTSDYDGQEHAVTGYDVEIDSKLYTEEDFTFSGTAEAKRTDAGTTNMGLSAEQFANTNPNFATVTFNVTDGYQTIEAINVTVTITGKNDTSAYDGKEHSVSGYNVESSSPLFTEADITFSGTAEAVRTDAGTTYMGLSAEQFASTNPNFATVTFNVEDGYQTIDPINVTVTIIGNNNTTNYDGAEHKVTGYKAEASSPLYDVEKDFAFSGTAEAARTDAGTTQMGLTEDQFENTNPNFKSVTFVITDGYQTVNPIRVTITIVGANNTANYDGEEHKVTGYTATASSPLYNVEKDFTFSGAAEAARTEAGTTNMNLAAEQFTNTNSNFTDVTFNVTDGYQTIDPIDVVVTIVGNNNTADYDGNEHKVSGYTATSSSDLYNVEKDFTFSGTAEAARTEAGTTNMNLAAEQFTNTNKNFATVTFNVTDGYQTIGKINVTVTITGHHSSVTFDGTEHSVSGYDVEISNELYTEKDFTFSGTAVAARTEAGTTNMNLAAEQFTNTNTNFETVTFNVTDGYQTIVPVDEVVVTITGHHNTTDYDGKEHSVSGYDVEISNPLYKEADFTFSGKAEAARTEAGTTNMNLAAEQFKNTNENFAKVTFNVTDGYQTIDPIHVTVTITGKNNTADYDGKEHKVTGYDVEISNELYTEKDFTFSGKAEAARTDAGTTKMGLDASQFANTNANFAKVTFNVTDGYQTIDPIHVTVTITGKNNTADYDGKEHSVSGYDVQSSSDLYTEKDFSFSGTAEAARTDAGTTKMGLDASQFVNTNANFASITFNITDGYQTIDPINATVTIIGNNNTTDYDGKEHSVTGYTATADSKLYDVEKDFTFSGTAEAKRTDAGTTNMNLAESQFTNTNPNFATVTFKVTDGYQTVDPIDVVVTIIGNNNTAVYDGQAHTVSGYTATADNTLFDVENDIIFNGTASATQTDAGTSSMGLSEDQFVNKNSNFANVTFKVTDGYQTIEAADVTVTITGHKDSVTYDGNEHAVTGYDVEISNDLYKESDFTFSGTAEVKSTDAGTYTMDLDPSQFENNNPNFNVTFEIAEDGDGELIVEPKHIVVKADDKTKVYGDEDPELTVTITGLVEGDSIDNEILVTREEGEDVGEYVIMVKLVRMEQGAIFSLRSAKPAASNYDITTEDGIFTITKAPLTITTESATKQYDGKPLTNDGAEITGLKNGDVATVVATGKQTEVGSSVNSYTITWGTTKASNYEITENLGTLTVTEEPVVPDVPTPDKGVKTGDNTQINLWIGLLAASASVLILLIILVFKRRKEQE